jgi:hypothetical protein
MRPFLPSPNGFVKVIIAIPLAVLWDFKGLRRVQARYSRFQIFCPARAKKSGMDLPFRRHEAAPVRADKSNVNISIYSDSRKEKSLLQPWLLFEASCRSRHGRPCLRCTPNRMRKAPVGGFPQPADCEKEGRRRRPANRQRAPNIDATRIGEKWLNLSKTPSSPKTRGLR